MVSAVTSTLENMAFMEVLPLSAEEREEHPVDEENIFAAQRVSRPLVGEFVLFMPKTMVQYVAEALYTQPKEELADHIQQDLLVEILNTVAGRFLNEYLSQDKIYKLELPKIVEEFNNDEKKPVKRWFFQMEGKVFGITVTDELVG